GQPCPEGGGGGPPSPAPQPIPTVARHFGISPPAGVSMDTSGNTYVGAAIFSSTDIDFDGHPVHSNGDADVFIAKFNTAGVAQWAVGFGDAAAAQFATQSAVTQEGTVAVMGRFTGALNIGNSITAAAEVDFIAGVQATNGAGKFAKALDTNNGTLLSIAANPSSSTNRIAICGKAAGLSADFAQGPFTSTPSTATSTSL